MAAEHQPIELNIRVRKNKTSLSVPLDLGKTSSCVRGTDNLACAHFNGLLNVKAGD